MKLTLLIQPGTALLIGLGVLGLLFWVFWPRRGLLALLGRVRMDRRRVLLEDTLKFVFDCEYKHLPCGLNSIAGNLGISPDEATHLLGRLRAMGLVDMDAQNFKLTDTGRSYALRIIRVHRIWERYLADETGFGQTEWHGEADQIEHRMSVEAADTLAAQMGNPVFDPHGDPIPTAKGEIPEHRGQPLSSLPEGAVAKIVHIEDEPNSIYEQLVALGLYPGMQVYVLDVTKERIAFAADGEERVLTPLFASSITVEPETGQAEPIPAVPRHELLSALELGEEAVVAGISPKCRGQQRRRLMDLGIVPGTPISAVMRSASGDPVGYRIMGATIAIRRDQAHQIYVQKKKEETNESA